VIGSASAGESTRTELTKRRLWALVPSAFGYLLDELELAIAGLRLTDQARRYDGPRLLVLFAGKVASLVCAA
jgi:hypothetical protein